MVSRKLDVQYLHLGLRLPRCLVRIHLLCSRGTMPANREMRRMPTGLYWQTMRR